MTDVQQKAKQRLAAPMNEALAQTLEQGERVEAAAQASTVAPPLFGIVIPAIMFALLITAFATLPLGALGYIVLAIVNGALIGAILAATTKRYAIALTDRRLIWLPWKGRAPKGASFSDPRAEARIVSSRSKLGGFSLTIRRSDGSEVRLSVPKLWEPELRAIETGLR